MEPQGHWDTQELWGCMGSPGSSLFPQTLLRDAGEQTPSAVSIQPRWGLAIRVSDLLLQHLHEQCIPGEVLGQAGQAASTAEPKGEAFMMGGCETVSCLLVSSL